METSYLAAAAALIWLALYYLPVGGALFRLALPLPLALLLIRRGWRAGLEGVAVSLLLLTALMGPVRGPLMLFPYGLLSLWLGWCWSQQRSWWLSWGIGLVLGAVGFLVRVLALSLLLGENLWIVITRAGAGLLDRLVDLLGLPLSPDLAEVQLMALALVLFQQLVYVLALHALAYWIFPRLQAPVPAPPPQLKGLVALDPL
ncbi:DUF2232 domain-containing protein [Synechococcus sp. HK01-R]|uniref:DUF2232 domain-containing protein n=1 Tax=Synechococcus sp. HK01-R TaxID=2751171 RepID=UPI002105ED87|nr:DUF2232 domain-containing protein [Synechococcus sp. HK01-R]